MIKIVPSGDYVQLKYVDTLGEYVQEELLSDSDAIEYSSSSNGRVYLQFGKMTFEDIEPTEFEIDSVAVTDAADFITKLTALFSSGGGGGITIYTGDGSLSENRTVDLANFDFFIKGYLDTSSNYNLGITSGGASTIIKGFNNTDNGSYGQLAATASVSDAQVQLRANFNDGVNNAAINLLSDVSASSATYTADTHTFNGILNLPTQSAPASPNDGDIWREDNTDTGLKIRINGLTKTITVS